MCLHSLLLLLRGMESLNRLGSRCCRVKTLFERVRLLLFLRFLVMLLFLFFLLLLSLFFTFLLFLFTCFLSRRSCFRICFRICSIFLQFRILVLRLLLFFRQLLLSNPFLLGFSRSLFF